MLDAIIDRLRRSPRRILRRLRTPQPAQSDDRFTPSSPSNCKPEDVARWNAEWLKYLATEWEAQLAHHSEFPGTPPLPDDPMALTDLMIGKAKLDLYCDRDALTGKDVMELGCGCGYLGKLLGRYVARYLGTDFSTLALKVARLVSPDNCTYVHLSDRSTLDRYRGTIDTVVGRHFWIHQNLELARMNLAFLEPFLKPNGRLYADFFWPDPATPQHDVRSPDQPLSRSHPSAGYKFTIADVERLIRGTSFKIQREEISVKMQRRFVVLDRASKGAG